MTEAAAVLEHSESGAPTERDVLPPVVRRTDDLRARRAALASAVETARTALGRARGRWEELIRDRTQRQVVPAAEVAVHGDAAVIKAEIADLEADLLASEGALRLVDEDLERLADPARRKAIEKRKAVYREAYEEYVAALAEADAVAHRTMVSALRRAFEARERMEAALGTGLGVIGDMGGVDGLRKRLGERLSFALRGYVDARAFAAVEGHRPDERPWAEAERVYMGRVSLEDLS